MNDQNITEAFDALFNLGQECPLHDAHAETLDVAYRAIIGAIISGNYAWVIRCIRGIFALGVHAAQQDAGLDVWRDALDLESALAELEDPDDAS